MVADVVRSNPYKSDAFLWCDIGYFRFPEHLPACASFPAGDAIDRRRVTFLQVIPFTDDDRMAAAQGTISDRFKFRDALGAGIFGGGAGAENHPVS